MEYRNEYESDFRTDQPVIYGFYNGTHERRRTEDQIPGFGRYGKLGQDIHQFSDIGVRIGMFHAGIQGIPG